MSTWGVHKAQGGSRIRPPAVYFRDGADDAITFEAVLSVDSKEWGSREVAIFWNEDIAKTVCDQLNATGPGSASEPQKCPTCGSKSEIMRDHNDEGEHVSYCGDPFHASTPPARPEVEGLLAATLRENLCGDTECEDYRLDAALRVLRGGPTHRANAELVNATEDAWRDAAGTEATMRKNAEVALAKEHKMRRRYADRIYELRKEVARQVALRSLSVQPEVEAALVKADEAVRRASWFVVGHSWPEPFMSECMAAERAFDEYKAARALLDAQRTKP